MSIEYWPPTEMLPARILDMIPGRKKGRHERLSNRTIKLINRGRKILLKRADGFYVSDWTNLAAAREDVSWMVRGHAQTFSDLEVAFVWAKYLGCKVVSVPL